MIEKTSECPCVRDELVTSDVDLQNGGDENGGSGDDVIRPTTNASAKDALLTLSRNTQVRYSWVKWGRYRSICYPLLPSVVIYLLNSCVYGLRCFSCVLFSRFSHVFQLCVNDTSQLIVFETAAGRGGGEGGEGATRKVARLHISGFLSPDLLHCDVSQRKQTRSCHAFTFVTRAYVL